MQILTLAFLLLVSSGDGESVYKALDQNDSTALERYDTKKIMKAIREGRPVSKAKTGQFRLEVEDQFGRSTEVIVRVPTKYNPKKGAGVLFVLHGLGGNCEQLIDLYRTYAKKQGLIIVAPTAQKTPEKDANEDRPPPIISERMPHWWYYRDGNFVFTMLSRLKKEYRIDENRVILSGYSMGGYGTWNLGLRFPDRFSALVPFAGGISRNEYLQKRDKKVRPLMRNLYNLPVYFIHGDRDYTVVVRQARETRDQLDEFGYPYEYWEEAGGGHMLNVREGSEIMNSVQKWLSPKTRKAHPKKIDHFFIGEYCSQAYWLKVEEFSSKNAQITASITGQNIQFEGTGASRLTFYVDETLLDLSKPIRVMSGGKTIWRGKAKPSSDVILESWKASEDRDLTYRAKISVELD
jgi:predicted esterase